MVVAPFMMELRLMALLTTLPMYRKFIRPWSRLSATEFYRPQRTCANIGNVLWNWRMLQITGDAKYADVMELALHNSVLSGISLDGKNFLYTNPLAQSDDLPFKQRWSKDRVPYIALSNCCPPNVVRTIAEVSDYVYSVSDKGLWFNLYGGNNLSTKLTDGTKISLAEENQLSLGWKCKNRS